MASLTSKTGDLAGCAGLLLAGLAGGVEWVLSRNNLAVSGLQSVNLGVKFRDVGAAPLESINLFADQECQAVRWALLSGHPAGRWIGRLFRSWLG